MKNKRKRTFARVLAVALIVLSLVSLLGVSAFAFQYDSLNEGGLVGSFQQDLADPIYSSDYDILPVGALIQENMQGMIGAVPWEEYGGLLYGFEYSDYIENSKAPVCALEYLVVRCEVDQVMGNHQYDIVSDGNYFFPDRDIASYYENGLRVVQFGDNTIRYSFLENFYQNYALPLSEYNGLVKYQLYCVFYHYDFGEASPSASVSKKEYNELKAKYNDEKSARLNAEGQLEVKAKELKSLQENYDSLSAKNSDLTAEKERLLNEKESLLNEKNTIAQKLSETEDSLTAAREGIANNNAVTKFFDGIYRTVAQTLNQFFNLDVFGMPLGSIIAILLAALVVIVVLKLVL